MASFKIPLDNQHVIDIETSNWNGKEVVSYDGMVVSKKRSFMYLTAHAFNATEDGQNVIYEVNVVTGLAGHGYIVRRNGIILAHNP